MIGTPEYKLAKFLDAIVKPYIPQTYMLKSNKQFLDRIHNYQFDTNQRLVSFDVLSLFTNVLLEETIQLINKSIHDSKHQDVKKQIIPRGIVIKILRMATQGMFMHKNKLYQQYDGVSMESPLGPTIANFFLANVENKILQNNADFYPKLYLRYVDDIFCVSNESGIATKIYRKQTHTNLLLNFNAIFSINWKSGLIIFFFNRAEIVFSTTALFQKEVKELT